jgi:hypothetical protein
VVPVPEIEVTFSTLPFESMTVVPTVTALDVGQFGDVCGGTRFPDESKFRVPVILLDPVASPEGSATE